MKKLFISLPMKDKTEKEIKETMKFCKALVENYLKEQVILIDTFINEEPESNEINNTGLYYLGKSIEMMAYADIAIFANGWMKARGCKVEYKAAVEYGVKILYEDRLFIKLILKPKGERDENNNR